MNNEIRSRLIIELQGVQMDIEKARRSLLQGKEPNMAALRRAKKRFNLIARKLGL